MAFKISMKTNLLICLVVFIIASFFRLELLEIYLNFWVNLPYWFVTNRFIGIPLMVVLIGVICIVHELLHGIGYTVIGGKVKCGFKWRLMAFYCQETTGLHMTKLQFCIVLLTPLVGIALLSTLLFPPSVARMIRLLNLGGASGDIYMLMIVLFQKDSCKIIDTDYGFYVIRHQTILNETARTGKGQ